MPSRRVITVVLGVVVVLVAAGVLVTALGGDDGAPPTQAGFTAYTASAQGTTVRFAYPSGWGPVRRSTDRGADVFAVKAPEGADGTRPEIELRVSRATADFDSFVKIGMGLATVDAGSGARVLSDRDVDVSGADHGHEVRTAYRVANSGGTDVPAHSTTVYAQRENGAPFVNFGVFAADGAKADPGKIAGTLALG